MDEERPVRPMASEAWEGNAHVANLEALMLRLLSPLGPDEDWPERRDLGLALCGAIRAEIEQAIALDVAGIEPPEGGTGAAPAVWTRLQPLTFEADIRDGNRDGDVGCQQPHRCQIGHVLLACERERERDEARAKARRLRSALQFCISAHETGRFETAQAAYEAARWALDDAGTGAGS